MVLFPVVGHTRSYLLLVLTASINASSTNTLILKFLSLLRLLLHLINSKISGWPMGMRAILAPMRALPCCTASVQALIASINDIGPPALPFVDDTRAPFGLI